MTPTPDIEAALNAHLETALATIADREMARTDRLVRSSFLHGARDEAAACKLPNAEASLLASLAACVREAAKEMPIDTVPEQMGKLHSEHLVKAAYLAGVRAERLAAKRRDQHKLNTAETACWAAHS